MHPRQLVLLFDEADGLQPEPLLPVLAQLRGGSPSRLEGLFPVDARALGPLEAPAVIGLAAILFHAMYAVATTLHTLPGASVRAAAGRGAALGFVTCATYELTNWAVILDWPAWLVPIDMAWGVALTATLVRSATPPPAPRLRRLTYSW